MTAAPLSLTLHAACVSITKSLPSQGGQPFPKQARTGHPAWSGCVTSTYENPSGAMAPTHLAVNWVVCHFGQFVNSRSLSFLLYEVEAKNMYITASLKGLKVTVTQSLCHYRMCSINGSSSRRWLWLWWLRQGWALESRTLLEQGHLHINTIKWGAGQSAGVRKVRGCK